LFDEAEVLAQTSTQAQDIAPIAAQEAATDVPSDKSDVKPARALTPCFQSSAKSCQSCSNRGERRNNACYPSLPIGQVRWPQIKNEDLNGPESGTVNRNQSGALTLSHEAVKAERQRDDHQYQQEPRQLCPSRIGINFRSMLIQ